MTDHAKALKALETDFRNMDATEVGGRLGHEEPRSAIILFGSVVESHISDLLENYFKEAEVDGEVILDLYGARTFAQRIDLAFKLDLIDQGTKERAHLVRNMRNAAAHSMEKIDFAHPTIAAAADELIGTDRFVDPQYKQWIFGLRCFAIGVYLDDEKTFSQGVSDAIRKWESVRIKPEA